MTQWSLDGMNAEGKRELNSSSRLQWSIIIHQYQITLNLNVKEMGFVTISCFLFTAYSNSVLNTLLVATCQGGVGVPWSATWSGVR